MGPVEGEQRTVDRLDPGMGVEHLPAQKVEDLLGCCRYIGHGLLGLDLAREPQRPFHAVRHDNAELGQHAADHVHQLGALPDQQVAGAMKQQGSLLLG